MTKATDMTDSTETPNRSKVPTSYGFGIDDEPIVIHGSQSDELGTTYWPPRLRCPQTGGTVSDTTLATTGTLWSWTFVHLPWSGEETPNGVDDGYAVGLIDLDDDGPRLGMVLLGAPDSFEVGMRVEARELHFKTIDGNPQSILAFERLAG